MLLGGVVVVVLAVLAAVGGLGGRAAHLDTPCALDGTHLVAGGADVELDWLFRCWAMRHGKTYAGSQATHARREVFRDNVRRIREHNARGDSTYRLGLTEFADLSQDEFQAFVGMRGIKGFGLDSCAHAQAGAAVGSASSSANHTNPPDFIDWRAYGIVSPVKNQGRCGSCWAFATTAALEAHWSRKHGRLITLSEQQLVDCTGNYENFGCAGGYPSHAFQYVLENGGINGDTVYPYVSAQGQEGPKCRFMKYLARAQVKEVVNITMGHEDEIRRAVGLLGPVSMAFFVTGDFHLYQSGVWQTDSCRNGTMDLNHATTIVGYGRSDDDGAGTPYWIVKNSWGRNWGDQGFFKIRRGVNMCGVADCASFAVVA